VPIAIAAAAFGASRAIHSAVVIGRSAPSFPQGCSPVDDQYPPVSPAFVSSGI